MKINIYKSKVLSIELFCLINRLFWEYFRCFSTYTRLHGQSQNTITLKTNFHSMATSVNKHTVHLPMQRNAGERK